MDSVVHLGPPLQVIIPAATLVLMGIVWHVACPRLDTLFK